MEKGLNLAELAKRTNAQLIGDPAHEIKGVSDLESATQLDASFLANEKYRPLLSKTDAGVICISIDTPPPDGKNCLVSDDPSVTFQAIIDLFLKDRKTTGFSGIHPTAVIHETAHIGQNVSIGPYAVIDADASIGDGTTLSAHTYVGAGSILGEGCLLHPHSTVREYCQLGNRVILQPGAVVGSCGFGYSTDKQGTHTKQEQLGNVIIEDDVEIGANATIDRARFKTTRIGEGTKIDNLVQIAHNVELGKSNIIAAQTGIAGSAKTGRNVMMGGQVGIVGHLSICDFAMIATRGGVSKSLHTPGAYAGGPVVPLAEHNKTQVHLRKISSLVKRVQELEERLNNCFASDSRR